jgi:hypothetical protein
LPAAWPQNDSNSLSLLFPIPSSPSYRGWTRLPPSTVPSPPNKTPATWIHKHQDDSFFLFLPEYLTSESRTTNERWMTNDVENEQKQDNSRNRTTTTHHAHMNVQSAKHMNERTSDRTLTLKDRFQKYLHINVTHVRNMICLKPEL